MTCCGKECETQFCPNCGKRLKMSPDIYGLLALCRTSEKSRRSASKNYAKHAAISANDPVKSEDYREASERELRHSEKWKAWGVALEALLDGNDSQ